MPTPTRLRPVRPTRNYYSRRFDAPKTQNSADKRQTSISEDLDGDISHRPKPSRSTSYTSPLPLGSPAETSKTSAPLTKDNLQTLQRGLESRKSTPPCLDSGSTRHGDHEHRDMPKTKSSKKSSSRKSKLDPDSHPLNLPPDDLRRLSAAMAREEARNATPMDLDDPPIPMTNGDSQPTTPAMEAPGAFPDTHTNGLDAEQEKSPTPPPHKPQKVDPEACKAAGNKYFKAKDYDRAVQEYSKAVDAEPANPTYLSNRAAAYISAGKYELALSDSLTASRLDPGNDKVLHRLARIYTSLGRPQDALDTYSRISNASATDTAAAKKAQHSISVAEKQIDSADGNGNMALWSIDQAKQTLGFGTPTPRNWQILRAKANLKIGSQNALGEVQGITQALMRENPGDAEAIALAGRSFYLKDDKPAAGKSDYDRAEQYFRQALSFDPDNTDARNWLRTMKKLQKARDEANAFFKRGNYSSAVDNYTTALEIDPTNKITNSKLMGNRAMAKMKLKDYDGARSDCDLALKLDPTYTKAKRTRAKAVGEGGDWEQAVRDLKALTEENPGDGDFAKELRSAEIELKKSKRKDYYKILGVDKDAGDKEIEKAYKRKAALLHPDKTQGDEEKTKQFKDCLEAKEILTDPQKRHMFDQGLDPNDPTGGMGGGDGGFPGGMGGQGMQIDPEILMQMFGGGMGGGRSGGGGFPGGMGGGGGFPGGFSFSTGGPGMGGRGGHSHPFG